MYRDRSRRIARRAARSVLSPKPIIGATLGTLLVASGLYYVREVEPADVEVASISLVLPRLAREFDGYRVAQISDLHAQDRMTPGGLLGLVNLVNAEAPDLTVITGDFATYSRFRSLLHHVPGLAAPLRRLRAPDGVFAVLGNHDHETEPPVVRRALDASGVAELRNAVHTLRRGGAALHLCGVDDVKEGASRLDQVLEELPEEGAAVLFAHEPDFADTSAETGRFDLQISGHSHGGQARLPLLGPMFVPKLSRKYPSGLYDVGGMPLYTNRGVGAHPWFRFNCRPEITLFNLRMP